MHIGHRPIRGSLNITDYSKSHSDHLLLSLFAKLNCCAGIGVGVIVHLWVAYMFQLDATSLTTRSLLSVSGLIAACEYIYENIDSSLTFFC